MNWLMFKVEHALSALKESGALDTSQYHTHAKELDSQCGCALGGVFMVAALMGCGWYALAEPQLVSFKMVLLACLLSFAVGMVGKALGLAIAWLRLLLLYRTLMIHGKEVAHVNVH